MSFVSGARRSFVALVVVSLALVVAPLTVQAQPAPKPPKSAAQTKSEASRLKSAADVLMDQDRYADALVLYERAYELSSDPALLYNEGRAHEALGDYPKALEKLETFEQQAPPAVRALVPGLRELITDLRGRMATIVIKTNAPNARVLLRQKDEGAVNGERRLPTRAGQASVEVAADGYETFRRDLELSAGTTVTVDANLVLKKRDALIVVRTTPSADVLFDGKALGRAPLQVHATPGTHELVATANGYYEERVAMTLALGDRRDIELELRKTPGIASKWWFWTGIGAVVLGGVATAVVLTREKPHSNGTFGTGSVAGP
jgi:tetratricopeptide (TPR) repeat protein